MTTSAEARARVLFVLFLLALAGAGLAWYLLASSRLATYEIRSRDAVSGLIPGAPVEFHGVEVGRVEAVQLESPRSVRVLLAVQRDVPVTSATIATITGRGLATRGFTGYVYVALEEAADGGRPLAATSGGAWPVIASAPSQLAGMDTAVAQLNQNMQAVTALLQATLDPQTLASMKRSLAGLEQVTHTLSANNERMVQILANAERASAQVQPLLRSSNEAVQALRTQVLPQAQETLVRLEGLSTSVNGRMDAILRNTEQASTRVGPLLQSSNEAVRSLEAEILPQAQRTLTRLDHLSSSLGQSADRIRRNPSLLLRGAAALPDGPGEAP
jgi:ABC-type transporter Mla subunit MlaD